MKMNDNLGFGHAKRAVVKVGSNVLTEDNGLNLKSNHIKQVLGHKSYDEVIHRDNLAITARSEV
ncbi:MAG: hypothetical protein PVF37_20575 [Desulfobacterales bacterium]